MENNNQQEDYNINLQVMNDQDQVKIVSVWDWIGVIILMAIPLINLIMLFVWAFSEETNPSKKNYARATLIIFAIIILLFIFFGLSILSNFTFV